jgi:heat shock protein HtpX
MIVSPLDEGERRRHKRRNRLQSALLLGGMAALLALCGWSVAGIEGVVWTLLLGGVMVAFSPRLPPYWLLRMYGAQRLHPAELVELHELLRWLAERAGLERLPELYYVPSPVLNAFAVGRPDRSVIALTDGLLRHLDLRELAAVLAHEISHIRNDDLWLMTLADVISRLTGAMALVGMMLLGMNLPLLLLGAETFPWLLILLLLVAPVIGSLLQLALSRTRELEADLDAAGLTGDPAGLASALAKLERYRARLWEGLLLPGRRVPEPSILRTHPDTRERIERLLALRAPPAAPRRPEPQLVLVPTRLRPVQRRPRWRATGLWY